MRVDPPQPRGRIDSASRPEGREAGKPGTGQARAPDQAAMRFQGGTSAGTKRLAERLEPVARDRGRRSVEQRSRSACAAELDLLGRWCRVIGVRDAVLEHGCCRARRESARDMASSSQSGTTASATGAARRSASRSSGTSRSSSRPASSSRHQKRTGAGAAAMAAARARSGVTEPLPHHARHDLRPSVRRRRRTTAPGRAAAARRSGRSRPPATGRRRRPRPPAPPAPAPPAVRRAAPARPRSPAANGTSTIRAPAARPSTTVL